MIPITPTKIICQRLMKSRSGYASSNPQWKLLIDISIQRKTLVNALRITVIFGVCLLITISIYYVSISQIHFVSNVHLFIDFPDAGIVCLFFLCVCYDWRNREKELSPSLYSDKLNTYRLARRINLKKKTTDIIIEYPYRIQYYDETHFLTRLYQNDDG